MGDLGEEGDFWGDDAMAARPALGDGGDGCEAPEPWEAAPGSRALARGDPLGEKPRRTAARVRAEGQLRQGKGAARQPERDRASGRCGV